MLDVGDRQSPGWWMRRLALAMNHRRVSPFWSQRSLPPSMSSEVRHRPGLIVLDDYLRGEPPLPLVGDWPASVVAMVRMARMNYAELVVGSVLDRLHPVAWRTSLESDRDGDDVVHRIAKNAQLSLVLSDVFEDMLSQGVGYAHVSLVDGAPAVTAEDPWWTITAKDVYGRTAAGLRSVVDEWTGDAQQQLYLRSGGRVTLHVARKSDPQDRLSTIEFDPRLWTWDDDGPAGIDVPGVSRIPLVEVVNRRGVAEYEPHLDVLDRINNTIWDWLVIGKHQAHRQRGLKNLPDVYPPGHPRAGEKIDYTGVFTADPGSLWKLPPDTEVWESAVTDLGPLRLATKDDVQALAAVTRTPLHYITPDAANGSAEGASTMKEAFVYRALDRRRRAEHATNQVVSLALELSGEHDRADLSALTTIWAPLERHSLSETYQSAVAAKQAGLPQESVFTDIMGYPPAELSRLQGERARDLLYAPGVSTGV